VGELVARVEAVYRRRRAARTDGVRPEVIEVDGVSLDLARHTVVVDGDSVTLSRKEFQVLALLATAGGAVCTAHGSWPRCGAQPGRGPTGRWTSRGDPAHQAAPARARADRAGVGYGWACRPPASRGGWCGAGCWSP